MFRNYITTALRNLVKNRLYSAINILGLAIGLAACLLIFLFVRFELSYDDWLPAAEKTYRLETTFNVPGREPIVTAYSMAPLRSVMEQQVPEIEKIARFAPFWISLSRDNILFNEQAVYSDPEILDFFDFTYLEGSRDGALTHPTSIVLSRSVKEKYFGSAPALGETVILDGDVPYTVDAVIEDLPDNTHFLLNIIAPISAPTFYPRDRIETRWDRGSVMTYVRLADGASPDVVSRTFDSIIETNVPEVNFQGTSIPGPDVIDLRIEPVTDIHLFSTSTSNVKPGGNPNIVYLFTGVAFLILSIAIVNFVGLTTARYTLRNKEVALRKVLGASRKDLIIQFLGEAAMVMSVAILIAIVLGEMTLPWFNGLVALDLSLSMLLTPINIALALFFIGLTTVASGLYPAFYLSSARPAATLGERGGVFFKPSFMRSAIVFFQFTITIVLIVAVTVIYQQTNYAQNLDLGFEADNRLVISGIRRGPNETIYNTDTLKEQFLRHPDILTVAASQGIPSGAIRSTGTFQRLNGGTAESFTLSTLSVGLDFFQAFGIDPVAGRLFSRDFSTDDLTSPTTAPPKTSAAIIVNESAARQLGFAQPVDALNQLVRQNPGDGNLYEFTIVGVVPDFKWRSALDPVQPIIFYSDRSQIAHLTLHLREGFGNDVYAHIDEVWNGVFADQEIVRQFLPDMMRQLFLAEDTLITILLAFAALAMGVAGLGLFGLAAFAIQRRTREIAIRKVLGAGIPDILRLLVWQFSKPVLLANLIAWPIAYGAMTDWLAGYAFRIDLTLAPFLFAAMAALFAAISTVSSHAINVARANPIHALRYE